MKTDREWEICQASLLSIPEIVPEATRINLVTSGKLQSELLYLKERVKLGYEGAFSDHVTRYDEP